jgi:hypothetical protein
MAILKNKLKASYTDIPNELITDSKVSHGAFRVAVYLFSKPNDWHVNNTDIKKQLGIKDNQTLANYWKSLISSGWLSREKERDEKGNYTGSYEYSINLTPNCGKTLIRENTESGKNHIHTNPDLLTNPNYTNRGSVKFLKSETLKTELEQKFPALNIPEEIEKMTDWLKANGKRKKDYAAFARTWCRNAVKYQKENNKRANQQTDHAPIFKPLKYEYA